MKTLEDQQQNVEELSQLTQKMAQKLDEINQSNSKADVSFELAIKEVLLELIKETREDLPFSLTPKHVEKLLPVSSTKVYKLLERGEIPGKKIDGKWAIQRDLFLAWYYVYEVKSTDDFAKVI